MGQSNTALLAPGQPDGRVRPDAWACYTLAPAPIARTGRGPPVPVPMLPASIPTPLPSPSLHACCASALPCFPRTHRDCLHPCRHLPLLPLPVIEQTSIPLLPTRMHDAPATATGGSGRWGTFQRVEHHNLLLKHPYKTLATYV
jgi:hypothetical protein